MQQPVFVFQAELRLMSPPAVQAVCSYLTRSISTTCVLCLCLHVLLIAGRRHPHPTSSTRLPAPDSSALHKLCATNVARAQRMLVLVLGVVEPETRRYKSASVNVLLL